jgi:hypothetical protein
LLARKQALKLVRVRWSTVFQWRRHILKVISGKKQAPAIVAPRRGAIITGYYRRGYYKPCPQSSNRERSSE